MSDNPQAFPPVSDDYMTLRDWLAGQAIAGAADGCNTPAYTNGMPPDFSSYARQQAMLAYAIADAMLAERERKP